MKQNKLLLYGAICILVSITASCVGQPLQEDIVCNKNVNSDQLSEYTGVQPQSGTIYCIAVYDGDTITIEPGKQVRLIGIDAPELSEPGGDIARNYLQCLVLHKEVTLEKGDVNTDSYGRLLRYVFVNGVCINEEMIKNGYAEARYIPEVNRELYIALEIEAETSKLALWKCTVFQPRSVEWDDDIPVIKWKNAGKYVNQYVIVTGTIVNTYNSGGACFLNFHTDQKTRFTVVIFACDFLGFPVTPDMYYKGKTVTIIGIIQEYKGTPEIIVKTPAQIRIGN
ncbi:MAG: thermonuclease family protein [Candidatus Methanofastidiosia archaeon]|jgi:micrococcal nuclease